jgi:hypothetical protein
LEGDRGKAHGASSLLHAGFAGTGATSLRQVGKSYTKIARDALEIVA